MSESKSGLEGLDAARLMPLVYGQLRALARSYIRGERAGISLNPTALVHEAYLRLVGLERIEWHGKTHFYALAATQMRRLLVEHARAAGAQKRGAGARRITLHDGVAITPERRLDLLALDQALERLSQRHERQARVAELRVFAGMTASEIAQDVGVTERTIKKDWKMAKAWLAHELSRR